MTTCPRDRFQYFVNNFCIFSNEQTISCIGAITCFGGIILMGIFIKKAIKKRKLIVEPNPNLPQNQDQTYCSLNLYMINVLIVFIALSGLQFGLYTFKFALEQNYNAVYFIEAMRNCQDIDGIKESYTFMQFVQLILDIIASTVKIAIILLQICEW